MQGETKSLLPIMFALFAFANPLSELFATIYSLLLRTTLTQTQFIATYAIIKVVSSIVFIVLAFYYASKTEKKFKRMKLAGIILAILSLANIAFYAYAILKVAGYI